MHLQFALRPDRPPELVAGSGGSIKNVVEDPRVALIFLVPGANETYRVNGRARVSVDCPPPVRRR